MATLPRTIIKVWESKNSMVTMLSVLQAALIILIFLLIITQTVSIRIRYSKSLIIDFNLTLVSFSFSPPKRKRRDGLTSAQPSVSEVLKIIKYALSKSRITINSFPELYPNSYTPLIYGFSEALRYTVIAYLEKASVFVRYSEAKTSDHILDVTFDISLYHLARTVMLYFEECHRSRRKARARL